MAGCSSHMNLEIQILPYVPQKGKNLEHDYRQVTLRILTMPLLVTSASYGFVFNTVLRMRIVYDERQKRGTVNQTVTDNILMRRSAIAADRSKAAQDRNCCGDVAYVG